MNKLNKFGVFTIPDPVNTIDNESSEVCPPCMEQQQLSQNEQKVVVLLETNQFKTGDKEHAFNIVEHILTQYSGFNELQIQTLIKSLKTTQSKEQLIFAGSNIVGAEIYNRLLGYGIRPIIKNTVNRF